MPFNGETKSEKRETHTIEQHPKKDNSATIRDLGKKAIQSAAKEKPKK